MGYDCYALGTLDGNRDESTHFGVNVWGWGRIINAMDEVGMLDRDMPEPRWPYTYQQMNPDTPQWQEVTRTLRSQRSPNPLQVPFWKVSGNDGYIVTPEECYLIAHRLKRSDVSLARAFGEYCGRMVAKGGFEVW